jgi:hypothetical protein
MASGKSFPIFTIVLLFISNTTLAFMCARLKSVSAGEYHSLALMDNKTLWACGSNGYWQLGLGSSVDSSPTLKQVKGENGVSFLENVTTYDAGWKEDAKAIKISAKWLRFIVSLSNLNFYFCILIFNFPLGTAAIFRPAILYRFRGNYRNT